MVLTDKTALVTGSSRGIGRAIALKLAEAGADVAINYVTQQTAAEGVVNRIRDAGGRAMAIRGDVSRADELRHMFERVASEWGSLDIYVNNAIDVAAFGPVLRLKPETWRHTIDSHATTLLLAAQAASGLMKGRRGSIVALSSLGSRTCFKDYAAVGVGKAAVEALVRYLAAELGPRGIRVNAVSAGPIDTDALRSMPNFDRALQTSSDLLPARRMGMPDDVAEVVTFLCTDAARWIYGQTIVADGGFSLLSGPLASPSPAAAV
jgi:enoyl-[acyl-carrier protein] reductase III